MLDPHDSLSVEIAGLPAASTLALAVDGVIVTAPIAGLRAPFTLTPPVAWAVGHHTVALIARDGGETRTLASTEFIVP